MFSAEWTGASSRLAIHILEPNIFASEEAEQKGCRCIVQCGKLSMERFIPRSTGGVKDMVFKVLFGYGWEHFLASSN